MTVAATRLYFKDGRVKVEIALAKGKKQADKRETVKTREAEREARAAMTRGRRRE
jgi:SsrA-binding protein